MPLMVSTTAGTGIVHFLPRETYGWVFPAVMSRLYTLNFVSPVDFQVRLSFTAGRGWGQRGKSFARHCALGLTLHHGSVH